MAKYVLSFDTIQDGMDPFDDIVKLLIAKDAIPNSIASPVESTFVFKWKQGVCEFELHTVLENELEKLCFYCLGECCAFVNSKEKDEAIPSRKARIQSIIHNISK